jgi:hypothetical protein
VSIQIPDGRDCVDVITRGIAFTLFTEAGKEKTVLSYDESDGAGGTMTWSGGRSLPMGSLTDIYVGKSTPMFQLPHARDADQDLCLSFCADDLSVDVLAYNVYDRDVFLKGLNYLLERQGKDTELA